MYFAPQGVSLRRCGKGFIGHLSSMHLLSSCRLCADGSVQASSTFETTAAPGPATQTWCSRLRQWQSWLHLVVISLVENQNSVVAQSRVELGQGLTTILLVV